MTYMGVTCNGLASHAGVVPILLHVSYITLQKPEVSPGLMTLPLSLIHWIGTGFDLYLLTSKVQHLHCYMVHPTE